MNKTYKKRLTFSEEGHKRLHPLYEYISVNHQFIINNGSKGSKPSRIGNKIQVEFGCDVIVTIEGNNKNLTYTFEEKIRKNCWDDLAIEIESNSVEGFKKKGWIYTSLADYLLYVIPFCKTQHCYLIDMNNLQQWFYKNEKKYNLIIDNSEINHTKCKPIPIKDIKNFIGYKHYIIDENKNIFNVKNNKDFTIFQIINKKEEIIEFKNRKDYLTFIMDNSGCGRFENKKAGDLLNFYSKSITIL